jgi:hypothetical protein
MDVAARKAKLGERWTCFSCAAKFYDLHKPDPLCPKCGTNQRESPVFKQKSTKKKSAPKKPPRKLAPEPVEDEEVEIEGTLEPDELLEASPEGEQLEIEDLDMGEDEDISAVDVVDED